MPETYEGQSTDSIDHALESLRDNREVKVSGIKINGYSVSMRVDGEQIWVNVENPSGKSGSSNIFIFTDQHEFEGALERAGEWVRKYTGKMHEK